MTHVHQGEYLVCGSYSEAKVDKEASSSLHAELAEEPSSLSRAKKRRGPCIGPFFYALGLGDTTYFTLIFLVRG